MSLEFAYTIKLIFGVHVQRIKKKDDENKSEL